jgi:hypothetical protein
MGKIMARKKKDLQETSVLASKPDKTKGAREAFARISELWEKDRERYRADTKFFYVDHWPDQDRMKRDADNRLTLSIDKLSQYVHQVINESRQNRPTIKVRPVDSGSDVQTAEIFDGLCRHIQNRSNADTCYDIALECANVGGFGFLELTHDYANNDSYEQEIGFVPVNNPLQVFFGPHKQPDGSDVKEVFVTEDIPIDEFKDKYPDVDVSDWDTDGQKYGDWVGEKVRVAKRWRVVKKDRLVHFFEDGTVCTDDEYQRALKEGVICPPILKSKNIPKEVVMCSVLCGSGYIDEEVETIWKWIPVIPVWANIQNVDGEVRHVSMIHNVKDAQLLYDYSRSAFAERVGQTPEAPWIAAAGQVEEYLDEWNGKNRVRIQRYDPIDVNGTALPAPNRQSPSDIPMGFAKDAEISEMDIRSGLGMYQAIVGQRGNATSGIQEGLQQKKGEVATFHYQDNLARAIRHAGRIIVNAAPKVYDTKRVIRILGVDGSADMVQIDPRLPNASNKIGHMTIYNLNAGTYDVDVTVGPNFTTRRQEAAAGMAMLVQTNPAMWQTHGDLIAKSQDWPDADAFAKRSKLLLPPAIQQAELAQDSAQGKQDPKIAAVMAQAKAMVEQSNQQLQQASQQLQEKAAELAKEEQAVNAAKNDVEKNLMQVQYEKNLIAAKDAFTKQLVQAQEMAADAQQKATLTQALAKVEKVSSDYAQKVEDMLEKAKTEALIEKANGETQVHKDVSGNMIAQLQAIIEPMVNAMLAPRETKLLTDGNGMPIGSESRVVQ